MTYHNVTFPEEISQGSGFGTGYDTRVLELENGFENRLPRMVPWGRRKYNISRGITTRAQAIQVLRFFQLRQGALHSFKFKDWADYATTSSGYVDSANVITPFDVSLQLISGSSYQCVTTISDSAATITRPITKIIPGTIRVAVNGVEKFSPADYNVDTETGIVTLNTAGGALINVTAGFQFYTVVRFALESDQNLELALQSTQMTASVPDIILIEDVSTTSVSQIFPSGGTYNSTAAGTSFPVLSQLNGRFQTWSFFSAGSGLRLPALEDIPTGHIFSIYILNGSGFHSHVLKTYDSASICYLEIGAFVHVYCGFNSSGIKRWYVDVLDTATPP